jgi:hypothetical protein
MGIAIDDIMNDKPLRERGFLTKKAYYACVDVSVRRNIYK